MIDALKISTYGRINYRCNVSLEPDTHEGSDVQRIRPPAATSCKDDHAGLAGMRGEIGSMRGGEYPRLTFSLISCQMIRVIYRADE